MRPRRLALAFLFALAAQPLRAQEASTLRQRFTDEEQWMLSVVLSDPDQKKAFDSQAAAAAKADEAARSTFETRWRKRIVDFANTYHDHLTTKDIVPNASSVEKMVDDWEFAVMNHWLKHQSEAKREEVLKDLSDGNAVLGFMRGTVEKRVRESRKKAAAELARYLLTPQAVAAAKFVEKPAIEVARGAWGAGEQARRAPTPEDASRQAGRVFDQSPPQPGDAPPPVDASKPVPAPVPGAAPEKPPGLSAPITASPGGFKVTPPPSPIVDRESQAPKKSAFSVIARKAAPIAGGLLGALIGFLVGGPVGALIGAAAGAAAGFAARKMLDS